MLRSRLLPVLLHMGVIATYLFLYIPIIVLLIFSFNNAPFPAPWSGFTWHWYSELFVSAHLWVAFGNSLYIAAVSTVLSVVLSLLLIFSLVQGSHLDKALVLFYGNLVIPEIVVAVGLLSFFVFFSIPLGFASLIIAHTILGIGFVVPIMYARYQELDKRMIEASLDLGASVWQTFLRVVMPLIAPALFASALLVFILSFDDFVLAYFCAGSSVQTLSLYLLGMLRSGISPVANALSTILLICSSILVCIFCILTTRTRIF